MTPLTQGKGLDVDQYTLVIRALRVWISLGCTPEERAHPQPVDIDITVGFVDEPIGCRTDHLSDVLCYSKVTDALISSLQSEGYNLIEAVAQRAHSAVEVSIQEQGIKNGAFVDITIAKPHHPIASVHGPIIFQYRRRLLQKSSSV
jgi:dihydroneopterin aldolase